MFESIKKLFKDNKPKTYEEACEYVSLGIENDTVRSPGFHFFGGMGIRNDLGLWDKESPLHKHMLERFGLCHADDTGALISNGADALRNGKTYSPDEDIEFFKKHWRAYGLDPATMKPLDNNSALS